MRGRPTLRLNRLTAIATALVLSGALAGTLAACAAESTA